MVQVPALPENTSGNAPGQQVFYGIPPTCLCSFLSLRAIVTVTQADSGHLLLKALPKQGHLLEFSMKTYNATQEKVKL